jgi:hypothetical protein
MKINEIELINNQHFSKEALETWLKKSSPKGKLENFTVNYIEAGDQRGIILTDIDGNIAAYAGFVSRLNGSVWQAKNAMTYLPYQSQALVGKIYKMIKQDYKISLQSDMQQTSDGAKLWTKTLPSLGLKPMIFDTQTERILDPKTSGINMYPVAGPLENKWRYIWVLEASDHYPAQNLLPEGSLLMPYKGLWYNSN